MCWDVVGNAPLNLSHHIRNDWVLSTALIVATGRTEFHVEEEEEECILCKFEQMVELVALLQARNQLAHSKCSHFQCSKHSWLFCT